MFQHAPYAHGWGRILFLRERAPVHTPPPHTGKAHPKNRPPPENHSSPKERPHSSRTHAHGEHRKEGFGKDKSFERRGMGDWKEGNAINAPSPTHAYAHQTARTRHPRTRAEPNFPSFAEERRSTLPPAHGRGAHGKPPLQKTIPLQKNDHTAPILSPTGNIEKRDSIRTKVFEGEEVGVWGRGRGNLL